MLGLLYSSMNFYEETGMFKRYLSPFLSTLIAVIMLSSSTQIRLQPQHPNLTAIS